MLVDCQSHVFPRQYADILTKNKGNIRTVKDSNHYVVRYGDLQQFSLNPATYDPADTIADMDAAGVDVSVISVNIPGPELLDLELGIEGARVCNDYVAEVCSKYPGRFVGLASLPLQDVTESLNEFNRVLDSLDLRGLTLYSHVNGKPVDSAEFAPIFSLAEKCRVPLVLHPTVPTWGEVVIDFSMIPMMGFMVDTSIAMLRLILSGTMESHPELLIVHPHCGGVLPYLMPRVVEQTEVKGRGRDHITQSPADYYHRVYLDLVSPSVQAMRYAYEFSGAERLLFGSDRPWVKIEMFLELFDQLDIPNEDRNRIMGENACKLFNI